MVGASFVHNPGLFNAVVCYLPLLDMLRYHLLLAGASWREEYGDVDDERMREVILKYGPYQNLSAGKSYTKPFFLTSTADDRVHPGHARKMVAKIDSLGYPSLLFENTEGGHGGAANLEQTIKISAHVYTYLMQQLF